MTVHNALAVCNVITLSISVVSACFTEMESYFCRLSTK